MVLSGCIDEDFGVTIEQMEHDAFVASGISDFKMTGLVAVDVDFKTPGASNPVRVYDQYPYDEEGDLIKGIQPVYAFFLQDGAFKGGFSGAKAKKIYYLAVGGIGLPTLTRAEVIDGKLTIKADELTRASSANVGVLQRTAGTLSYEDYERVPATNTDLITLYDGNQNIDKVERSGHGGFYESLNMLFPWSISGYPCPTDPTSSFKTEGFSVGNWKGNQLGASDYSTPFCDVYSNAICLPENGRKTLKFTVHNDLNIPTPPYHGAWNAWVLTIRSKHTPTKVVDGETKPDGLEYLLFRSDAYGWKNGKGEGDNIFNASAYTLSPDWDWNTYNSDLNGASVTVDIVRDGVNVTYTATVVKNERTYTQTTTQVCPDIKANEIIYAFLSVDNSYLELDRDSFESNGGHMNMDSHYYASFKGDESHKDDSRGILSFGTDILPKSESAGTDYPDRFIQGWGKSSADTDGDPAADGFLYYYDLNADGAYLDIHVPQSSLESLEDVAQLFFHSPTEMSLQIVETNEEGIAIGTSKDVDTRYDEGGGFWVAQTFDLLGDHYYRVTADDKTKQNRLFFVSIMNRVFSRRPWTGYFRNQNGNWTEWSEESRGLGVFSLGAGSAIKVEGKSIPATSTVPAAIHSSGLDTQLSYYVEISSSTTPYLNVTVPNGKLVKMTLVFHENEKAKFVLDEETNSRAYNSTSNISDLGDNVYTCIITPGQHTIKGGGTKCRIYYVRLDVIDDYADYGTVDQTVKVFNNVNDADLTAQKNRLTNTLWRETGSKQLAKAEYGDGFNDRYTSADESKNNINIKKETELYVTFLDEYNMTAANTFGYYYYKTEDGAPDSPNDLQKFIVFPNCTSTNYDNSRKYKSIMRVDDKTVRDYASDDAKAYAPLQTGDQVQLAFFGEDGMGEKQEKFPAGYTVGWFIIYNGFDAWALKDVANDSGHLRSGKVRVGDINNFYEGRIMPDTRIYYSNPKYNTADNNGQPQARCIQLTDAVNGAVNLCFEDSYSPLDGHTGKQDWTYDDLLITVTAPDNNDIENPSGNETNGSDEVVNSYHELGTLLFEDIWNGNATDFDMNDVVVEYDHIWTIKKSGTESKITKVTEHFKVVNDGGTYDDGFAIVTPYNIEDIQSITVSVNGGKAESLGSDTYDLTNDGHYELDVKDGVSYVVLVPFYNINDLAMGTTYDFVITFKEANQPSLSTVIVDSSDKVTSIGNDFSRESYNPFIIVEKWKNSDEGKGNSAKRCEIHLADKPLTTKGMSSGNWQKNPDNNRWNVALLKNSGLYVPFGLDLPIPSFTGCRENVLVTVGFPQFAEWAASNNGQTNPDWYLYPVNDNTKIGWDRIGTEANPR